MNKKDIAILCSLTLVLGACSEGFSTDTPTKSGGLGEGHAPDSALVLETSVKLDGPDMLNYGQLNGVVTADSLLTLFEYGDVVTVVVADKDSFDAPVVSAWNDVSSGEYLVMAIEKTPYITMGKNYGQTGVDFGIAKPSDAQASTLYVLRDDVETPIKVKITMKEKGGYIDNLKMREKQNQGKKRENYPELSDAEYANFRAISTPGMGRDVLYRSSSPVDPSLGRNLYADSLAREAGVALFVNLTDNMNGLIQYEGFDDTYYSDQKFVALGLPAAFTSELFKNGFYRGLREIIETDGPYLIHCREGKDRAGFVAAVLEALMGASIKDIMDDYTKTYTNYYNVVDGFQDPLTKEDVAWFAKIIVLNLKLAFADMGIKNKDLEKQLHTLTSRGSLLLGVGNANPDREGDESSWMLEMQNLEAGLSISSESPEVIDELQKATEMYLRGLGLTEVEIAKLKKRLGESKS
ncbi:MAG: tyrosine-protein phosphatase [Fibrobacter sp.]|nr:tyrosine-protein phosphatase [Fibrobacter sp.]